MQMVLKVLQEMGSDFSSCGFEKDIFDKYLYNIYLYNIPLFILFRFIYLFKTHAVCCSDNYCIFSVERVS